MAKLLHVLLFAVEGLDHTHARDRLVVAPRNLRVDPAHIAILGDDAPLEEYRHNDNHRDDHQHNQRQMPVDAHHEPDCCDYVDRTPRQVKQTPCHQLGHAVRVGGDARDDPPNRRLVVVGERQVLQVVEHVPAQVIAHTLAQNAADVDEGEDHGGLKERQAAIDRHGAPKYSGVACHNCIIHNDEAQVGEH